MSWPLGAGVALAGLLYLVDAVGAYRTGLPGTALMLIGYAMANVGIIWQLYR